MNGSNQGKNIVLCSDGTGNSDTKNRGTNVFKLYEAVDIQGHKTAPGLTPQIAFYDDGVGTENFALAKALGAAFGLGFKRNVTDLYTELVHVYDPGDRLFLFGFSRGAYTIRALSGLIQYCGIIDRTRLNTQTGARDILAEMVEACWRTFEPVAFPRFITRDKDRKRLTNSPVVNRDISRVRVSLGCRADDIKIDFIGVWDTVGAVGLPADNGLKRIVNWICPRQFGELKPGPNVLCARHALSIDDERRTFHPELWNEAGAAEGQIDQVWFSGVHSNIGGGYPKQGMSLVTLHWMMSEAEKHGLRFIATARAFVEQQQDVHDRLNDSRAGVAVYYRWSPRNIQTLCETHEAMMPKIHVSVFERIAHGTDGYAPGNLPFNFAVVPAQLGSAKTSWPPHAACAEVSALVLDRCPSPSVGSILDTMTRTILSGQLSHAAFLVLTLTTVTLLAWPPQWLLAGTRFVFRHHLSAEHGAMLLAAAMFAMGAGLISRWAGMVDKAMERKCLGLWHGLREQIRHRF